MPGRDSPLPLTQRPVVRVLLLVAGVVLLVLAPIVGLLPGPGGIFVFAGGLALLLRSSGWARRRYVRFKRWQPTVGRWLDWGLRRRRRTRDPVPASSRDTPRP